jgi:hypothetical protein
LLNSVGDKQTLGLWSSPTRIAVRHCIALHRIASRFAIRDLVKQRKAGRQAGSVCWIHLQRRTDRQHDRYRVDRNKRFCIQKSDPDQKDWTVRRQQCDSLREAIKWRKADLQYNIAAGESRNI